MEPLMLKLWISIFLLLVVLAALDSLFDFQPSKSPRFTVHDCFLILYGLGWVWLIVDGLYLVFRYIWAL